MCVLSCAFLAACAGPVGQTSRADLRFSLGSLPRGAQEFTLDITLTPENGPAITHRETITQDTSAGAFPQMFSMEDLRYGRYGLKLEINAGTLPCAAGSTTVVIDSSLVLVDLGLVAAWIKPELTTIGGLASNGSPTAVPVNPQLRLVLDDSVPADCALSVEIYEGTGLSTSGFTAPAGSPVARAALSHRAGVDQYETSLSFSNGAASLKPLTNYLARVYSTMADGVSQNFPYCFRFSTKDEGCFVTINFDNPVQPGISFSGPSSVGSADPVTVAAPAGFASYAWSLNGVALAATGPSLAIAANDPARQIGANRVLLVVTQAGRPYSAEFAFNQTDLACYQFWNDIWTPSVTGGNALYVASQSANPVAASKTLSLVYNNNGAAAGSGVPAQTWYFLATAGTNGTIRFNWQISGNHMVTAAHVRLQAFSYLTSYDLLPDTVTNGAFNFSGTSFSLPIFAGEDYGFRVIGQNGDSDSILQGTVTITAQP